MPHKEQITQQTQTLQTRVARNLVGDYEEYRAAVLMDGSVEDKRKLVEFSARITNAEIKTPQDPNANLPVFNITIGQSGIQAELLHLPRGPDRTALADDVHDLLQLPDDVAAPVHLPLPLTALGGVEEARVVEVDGMLDSLDELEL